MESNQSEQMKEKICKVRTDLGNAVTLSKVITFALEGSQEEERYKGRKFI